MSWRVAADRLVKDLARAGEFLRELDEYPELKSTPTAARVRWALATAGEESNRIFRRLVKRGEEVDRAGRTRVKKLVARADEMREEAGTTLGSRIRRPSSATARSR